MGGNPPGVSAIIVTRGDCDLTPVLESIPSSWQRIVWNNGAGRVEISDQDEFGQDEVQSIPVPDLGVFGRYAALEYASNRICFVQDDDCVLDSPEKMLIKYVPGVLTTNIPYAFRSSERDVFTMLVGFGAIFDRDLPAKAFARFQERWPEFEAEEEGVYRRCSDIIFWTLSKADIVHVPLEMLPSSFAENRMWRQPEHTAERRRVLEMAEAA